MEQVTEKAELEQNQLGSQNKHTKQKSLKQTIINKHFVATRIRLAGYFFVVAITFYFPSDASQSRASISCRSNRKELQKQLDTIALAELTQER